MSVRDDLRSAFAKRLRDEMIAAGKTVREGRKVEPDVAALMQAAHVSRQSARSYLTGNAMPAGRKLLAVAEWLEVDPIWLRDGVGEKKRAPIDRLSFDEKIVIAYYRAAPLAGKATIMRAGRKAVAMAAGGEQQNGSDPVPKLSPADVRR